MQAAASTSAAPGQQLSPAQEHQLLFAVLDLKPDAPVIPSAGLSSKPTVCVTQIVEWHKQNLTCFLGSVCCAEVARGTRGSVNRRATKQW
jgi:hypothetical protein